MPNLTTLNITVPPLEKLIHLSQIYAHSIQGKIEEFQQQVTQEKQMFILVLNHG